MSIQSTHEDKGNALRTTYFLLRAAHAAVGLHLLQVLVDLPSRNEDQVYSLL